jgi:hypothetical protein
MLPKSIKTERTQYLQDVLNKFAPESLNTWPAPTKEDYQTIGMIIVFFGYIDYNLRSLLEILDHTGKVDDKWKGKTANLTMADAATAVQSSPIWPEEAVKALKEIELLRGLRNLMAHFMVRRFPNDDALVFVAKSTRDFKQQFNTLPELGQSLNAVMDGPQIQIYLKRIETLQKWISTASPALEKTLMPPAPPAES